MGIEYRLSLEAVDVGKIAVALASMRGARVMNAEGTLLEFWAELNTHEMPDATVSIEDYGVYFCDHGGHGPEFLGRVVATLVSLVDAVQVSELE